MTLTVEYKDHPFQSRFERHEDPVHYALGRKHTDWAYGREVRMLRHASEFARYATGMDGKVGLLPLPPEAVTDIVRGANLDVSVRTLLADQLRHFAEAKVRRLEIGSSGYNSRLREVHDLASFA